MLVDPAALIWLIAAFRIAASTCGPEPDQVRLASSPIVTSRTQCRRFSIPQSEDP